MSDIEEAHKFSSNHKEQLLKDSKCGCFYCCTIFNPNEIEEWIDDQTGTALCPYCDIDSVIGESCGYHITVEFLERMRNKFFH